MAGKQHVFDAIDRTIIKLLERDSRTTIKKIAKIVDLTYTPCRRRIRLLENNGYIAGYTIKAGNRLTKYNKHEYVKISFSKTDTASLQQMQDFLCSVPNVLMLDLIKGSFALLAVVGSSSDKEFAEFLRLVQKQSNHLNTETISTVENIKPFTKCLI